MAAQIMAAIDQRQQLHSSSKNTNKRFFLLERPEIQLIKQVKHAPDMVRRESLEADTQLALD